VAIDPNVSFLIVLHVDVGITHFKERKGGFKNGGKLDSAIADLIHF
jgi:hypothetical protein